MLFGIHSHLWKKKNKPVITAADCFRCTLIHHERKQTSKGAQGLVAMEVGLRAVSGEALVLVKYTI